MRAEALEFDCVVWASSPGCKSEPKCQTCGDLRRSNFTASRGPPERDLERGPAPKFGRGTGRCCHRRLLTATACLPAGFHTRHPVATSAQPMTNSAVPIHI